MVSGNQFITFDCVQFEHHGTCSYTLVKNCGGDIENFEIKGEFHRLKGTSVLGSLLINFQRTVSVLVYTRMVQNKLDTPSIDDISSNNRTCRNHFHIFIKHWCCMVKTALKANGEYRHDSHVKVTARIIACL